MILFKITIQPDAKEPINYQIGPLIQYMLEFPQGGDRIFYINENL